MKQFRFAYISNKFTYILAYRAKLHAGRFWTMMKWSHDMSWYFLKSTHNRHSIAHKRISSKSQHYSWCLFCLAICNTFSYWGPSSLSRRTSYRKISWNIESTRFGFELFQSFWNLTSTSAEAETSSAAELDVKYQSDTTSRGRDSTTFSGKTSYRLVNSGP